LVLNQHQPMLRLPQLLQPRMLKPLQLPQLKTLKPLQLLQLTLLKMPKPMLRLQQQLPKFQLQKPLKKIASKDLVVLNTAQISTKE